jgi:hypothetical protein
MTLAEIYSKQNNFKKQDSKPSNNQLNVVMHMPEVAGLIKHLDLLYTKLLMNGSLQQETKQISYFNPGQGIKQSAQVS